MKRGIFFLLIAGSLFAQDVIVNGESVTILDVSNKSENIFVFKEPITDSVFTKRQDGLIVKRNSVNPDREFLISFNVGSVFEMSPDGKNRVLVGTKYADQPADIFFYGKESKNKYIFRLNPIEKAKDLIYTINSVGGNSNAKITKDTIYEIEKKDSYRDLIIENQKNAFQTDPNNVVEKHYKKVAINKVALDDDTQVVTHLTRYTGATFLQDVYEVKSKINGLNVGAQNLYKYITLPPTKETKRAISVVMDTVLNKGETTILSVIKDNQ